MAQYRHHKKGDAVQHQIISSEIEVFEFVPCSQKIVNGMGTECPANHTGKGEKRAAGAKQFSCIFHKNLLEKGDVLFGPSWPEMPAPTSLLSAA